MNSENSQTSDRLLNLSTQINLKSKYKYVALSNLQNSKISAPTWNEYLMDRILYQIFKIILNIY